MSKLLDDKMTTFHFHYNSINSSAWLNWLLILSINICAKMFLISPTMTSYNFQMFPAGPHRRQIIKDYKKRIVFSKEMWSNVEHYLQVHDLGWHCSAGLVARAHLLHGPVCRRAPGQLVTQYQWSHILEFWSN